jgi:peptidoglycan/LPS O-acetylase OafA/YrhL
MVAVDVPHFGTHNYRQTPMCMDALAVGSLLAYLKLNKRELLDRVLKLRWLPVAALGGYFLIVLMAAGLPYLNHTLPRLLIAVFSFYLIGHAIYFMKGRIGRLLDHPVIQYLGKISYGLYLYHMIVSSVLQEPFSEWMIQLKPSIPGWLYYNPYLVSFPLYLGLTVIVATLSYHLIEKRFLELKSRLELKWNRKSNLPSSAAVA